MPRHVLKLECDYFEDKIGEDMEGAVSAFKFAWYINPVKVVYLLPTLNDTENLLFFLS